MGLDINAYSKLELIGVLEPESKQWDQERPTGTVRVYHCSIELTDENWPGRAEGLVAGGVYRINGEKHNFRAGSYGGYNHWREWLSFFALGVPPNAVWADEERYEGKPFVELINFSDCEGYIGPKVAAKLAADFAMYEKELSESEDSFYCHLYREWKRAFELAADNGLVDFL